ncbi:hypothetical protein D3C85_1649970 [compost metagenome]
MLKDAEGRIVADQSFKIASGGTGNRGATHACSGQHVVKTVKASNTRDRRGRQEPAGKRQQSDACQKGNDSQHNAQRQHPFMAFVQGEVRQQGAH